MTPKDYDFQTDAGALFVRVTPTMEALGDQPWRVDIYDATRFPLQQTLVEDSSALGAASEAVHEYLKDLGLNTSVIINA